MVRGKEAAHGSDAGMQSPRLRGASRLPTISRTGAWPEGNPTRAYAGVYRRSAPDRSQRLRGLCATRDYAQRGNTRKADLCATRDYAQRGETRREHLGELQAYLGVQPFGRQDYRTMARIAFNESIGTDRGEAIVGAMVVNLRQNSILLPSAAAPGLPLGSQVRTPVGHLGSLPRAVRPLLLTH
jgi:hypothetical protein